MVINCTGSFAISTIKIKLNGNLICFTLDECGKYCRLFPFAALSSITQFLLSGRWKVKLAILGQIAAGLKGEMC